LTGRVRVIVLFFAGFFLFGRFIAGISRDATGMPRADLADLIKDLSEQMMSAARDLQFELAARLRDEIADLKKELRGMDAAGLK
jgi:excinuclease UvrABC helicase subunit UvrB